MIFFKLLRNELKLNFYELKQYWFESVSATLLMCGMFGALFYGINSFSGDENKSLDGLLFGFLLWTFAVGAYSSVTKIVIENNHKGTLEQLFLCPAGFIQLMMARMTVELAWNVVSMTIMAVLTMAITSTWLDINFLYFYLILFIAGLSLVGLSFLICGLALVFKRVETIGAMMNIAIMAIVSLDALPFNALSLLPFSPGASLARDVILRHQPMNMMDLTVVILNSAVYLAIGLWVYKKMENRAKALNLIGQY